MPKIPKIKLAAVYLLKLAEEHAAANPEEQAHEMGETPEHEALEHLHSESEDPMSEYPEQGNPEGVSELPGHEQAELPAEEVVEHGEPSEGHEDSEVEHLISQLTPEQLDHLAAQLAEDMHDPGQHEGEDTAALAQAIQEHLAQNPEASLPEASHEKTASLNLIKSAEYIEGFLNEAVYHGATIKEAVDLYDSSLVDALSFVKTSEDKKKENFENLLADPEAIKEASFLEGFASEANNLGLSLDDTVALYKSAGSIRSSLKGITDKTMAIARRVARKSSVAAKRLTQAASQKVKDLEPTVRRIKRKAAVGAKRTFTTEPLEKDIRRHMDHVTRVRDTKANPFKPNSKRPESTQKTKTTQDTSKVVGISKIKEDSKVKLASLADLRRVVDKRVIAQMKSLLSKGKGVAHLNPGSAAIHPDAFNRAVNQLKGAAPRGGAHIPPRGGASAKSPVHGPSTPNNYRLLEQEYADIDRLAKKNGFPQEKIDFLKQQAEERHIGAIPTSAPAASKASQPKPVTANDVLSQKVHIDRQVAAGLHPDQAQQLLDRELEKHINELRNLSGDPFKNVDRANTELSKLVAGNAISPEKAKELSTLLREHHLNVKPIAPPKAAPDTRSMHQQSKERAAKIKSLESEINNPATSAERKAQAQMETVQLRNERDQGLASATNAEGARGPSGTEYELGSTRPPPGRTAAGASPAAGAPTGQGQAAELNAKLKAMHDQLGTSEANFAAHLGSIHSEQDLLNQIAAAEKQLQTQLPRHEAGVIAANKGLDSTRKIKGVSRSENNRLVTDMNAGVAPTWSDTFQQALEGANTPRMSGIGHNISNRLGRAGKVIADNPLTTGAALGAGALGVMSGSNNTPQELPAHYRQPVRQSRPQPLQQFS
jgi:hypothetical protein